MTKKGTPPAASVPPEPPPPGDAPAPEEKPKADPVEQTTKADGPPPNEVAAGEPAPPGPPTAPTTPAEPPAEAGLPTTQAAGPPLTDEQKKEMILPLVGRKIGLIHDLTSNTNARSALIGGQDFSNVEASDNLGTIATRVEGFLKEVTSDDENIQRFSAEGDRLRGELLETSEDLKKYEDKWGIEELKRLAPSEMGQLEVAAENLEYSTARDVEMTANYLKKVDDVAQEYIAAWDKTESNEGKREFMAALTSSIDILSGIGIGGNALVQFRTKDTKVDMLKLGDITNAFALRGGQVIDMGQAFLNAGVTITGLPNSSTTRDIIDGITELERKASKSINTLYSTLIGWRDRWESGRYEAL